MPFLGVLTRRRAPRRPAQETADDVGNAAALSKAQAQASKEAAAAIEPNMPTITAGSKYTSARAVHILVPGEQLAKEVRETPPAGSG